MDMSPPKYTAPTPSNSNAVWSKQAIQDMINRKTWFSEVVKNKWAVSSSDGKSVKWCVCIGWGRTQGVIKMQWAYAISAWDSHYETGGHRDNVAMKEVMAEEEELIHPAHAQSSLTHFFTVEKKKREKKKNKKGGTNKPPHVPVSALTTVDLTSD
eukprot:12963018-Ditylum_brightwellii.AAC.1